MRSIVRCVVSVLLVSALFPLVAEADVTIVRDGQPVAVVVVSPDAPKRERPRMSIPTDDKSAAQILVNWVKKMSGAELPIVGEPARGKPAIYVGAAAVEAGLKLDNIDSASNEGVRIICDAKRILIAGQNSTSTVKGVCRFLEELGCNYSMDIGPLGEVYPSKKTITVKPLNITERPGFLLRRIWGSNWSGQTLWKIWNGAGGVSMGTGHAWGRYVPRELFDEHPEYFALRGGQRRSGGWYCTSNPELRKIFAQHVIEAIGRGNKNASISPDDGVGYCECPVCRAQDDPNSIEPSSGKVNVTNRYADFIDYVGREVAKVHPSSVLGFYCYADYTQAPTSGIKLSPNICGWIAPIRYCRYHRTGHKGCPTREQLEELIDGWGKSAAKIAYRTYNFNLAECTLPFTLWSVWKHDIPMLKKKGCIGINLESLTNWAIYGPHLYLSIRLAYDPAADADAIMDNFFMKFYGPKAGPFVKQYWTEIDRAFQKLTSHTGCFYALHLVYTPEFLAKCRGILKKAAAAAGANEKYSQRVHICREGLRNAEQYIQLRNAMNRGDFARAKDVYDVLFSRVEANNKAGWGNHYTVDYLKRFIGNQTNAGAAAIAPPSKLLQMLPDRCRLEHDESQTGEKKGYHKPGFDDSKWRTVATYSNTLDAQGLPDRKTVMWYRTTFDVPARHGKLALFFAEVDGDATVYVNGRKITKTMQRTRRVGRGREAKRIVETVETDTFPKRKPFEVDVTKAVKPGRNVLAIRADHSRINELFLGGIVRPILLIDKGS